MSSEESDDELAQLESEMSVEDILKFQQRYENGYNLKEDQSYNKWKAVKDSRCVSIIILVPILILFSH